MVKKQQLC